jgi:tellurite resistance protein TehA-like permease
MILILVWLAVAAASGYEITRHALWHDGLAACAVAAFILWVFGGLVSFPVIRKRSRAREAAAMLAHVQELARKQTVKP